MKSRILIVDAALALVAAHASAQGRIWRCPNNEYTNNEAQARGCKLVEGGNVTVVEGTRVHGAPAARGEGATPPITGGTRVVSAPPRVGNDEQKARDAEARSILEAELKKAEARHAQLLKEYNNGEPEKLGPETRNHQKYLDRVAELKASIARNESDMAGIRRELARVGGTVPASK